MQVVHRPKFKNLPHSYSGHSSRRFSYTNNPNASICYATTYNSRSGIASICWSKSHKAHLTSYSANVHKSSSGEEIY